MLKVIGIISYLPDDKNIRGLRFQKLKKLIETCNQFFNLPIHIIIQNYREEELYLKGYKNVVLSPNYTRCGIVGARKKLREWFLNSQYDCLIMLDDDCEIVGTSRGGKIYLEELEQHPCGFGCFRGSQLKLFSITKDLLKFVDFNDDVKPEEGVGFEDTIFVSKLKKQFPKRWFDYSGKELTETSLCVGDDLSTWYSGQDISKMLATTDRIRRGFKL